MTVIGANMLSDVGGLFLRLRAIVCWTSCSATREPRASDRADTASNGLIRAV